MRVDRIESRRQWREMRDMINAWDPVGLIQDGAPPDEYDCLVGDVLCALKRGDSAERLAAFLEAHTIEHFECAARDPLSFAKQAVAWHASR